MSSPGRLVFHILSVGEISQIATTHVKLVTGICLVIQSQVDSDERRILLNCPAFKFVLLLQRFRNDKSSGHGERKNEKSVRLREKLSDHPRR